MTHQVEKDIISRYLSRSNHSKNHHEKAMQFLPGGDTRNATFYTPYPSYIEKGKGCYLYDCDGNSYIDYSNNFTSLIHGHCYPPIVDAVKKQLEKGDKNFDFLEDLRGE